jgi:Xaa-Pro aminopeptidase
MNVEEIQAALREEGLDGWLFYDHHHRDPLAYRILGLPETLHVTRRWYYFIPAQGEPRALVHRVEPHSLDGLPGSKAVYSRWREQADGLKRLLGGAKVVAMQHSPECAIPYVAMVDGGTVEIVQRLDVEVRTSADLVQMFEARWSTDQLDGHLEAGRRMDRLRGEAFELIRARLRDGVAVDEWEVYSFLRQRFGEEGLTTDHGPIVAVNANASDPHYEPSRERHSPIRRGDLVLIDMWAKLDRPDAVYYDITWTGFCGEHPPENMLDVFAVVSQARDRGIEAVQRGVAEQRTLRGFEVDDAVRAHIEQRGFGEYFIHRTGHSIGAEVHGAGANMDNFETHDERRVMARTCFSIEPGVYLPAFGIRSEVNVYVGEREAIVTGAIQRELLKLA